MSQIAVWVCNVPHALPKNTLVDVLAKLAGGDFVAPTNVIMTHRGAVRDNLDSWAMLHFATPSAAEQAVFLLNGFYSEQLGKRLVARVPNSMTTDNYAMAAFRRAEIAVANADAANAAAAESVAVAMDYKPRRRQEAAASKASSPTTLRPLPQPPGWPAGPDSAWGGPPRESLGETGEQEGSRESSSTSVRTWRPPPAKIVDERSSSSTWRPPLKKPRPPSTPPPRPPSTPPPQHMLTSNSVAVDVDTMSSVAAGVPTMSSVAADVPTISSVAAAEVPTMSSVADASVPMMPLVVRLPRPRLWHGFRLRKL